MKEWTVGAILKWSKDYLLAKDFSTPRLDAEILIADALGRDRVWLYTHFDQPLNESEKIAVRQRLQRRIDHEPIAYIVGKREFFGRKFIVNNHTLIPRPDTETVIEKTLQVLHSQPVDNPIRVLDIGAGSGCIGLTVALERSHVVVDLIEVSKSAVEVIKQNIASLEVDNIGDIYCEDVLNWSLAGPKYDLIVSNPPYISNDEKQVMSRETLEFEPSMALFAAEKGLRFYQFFAERIPDFLLPHGQLILEVGYKQAESVKKIFAANGRWSNAEVTLDLNGIPRVLSYRLIAAPEQLQN